MMECYWRKDLLGHWQFHWGGTSRKGVFQTWFNWRPKQFNLGFQFSVAPSGLHFEIALWFHWVVTILFFIPTPRGEAGYDEEDQDL